MQTRRRILVLSSTYPRWPDDHEPAFVHQLSRRLAENFEVHVLCPHAPGAKTTETLDQVTVHRYRYAPERWETLVQDGGILSNIKNHPWKRLLILPLFMAQLIATYRILASIKPHAVHAHWIIPQGLVYAIIAKFRRSTPPMIVTSHGADLFGLQSSLFTSLKRFTLSRATHITVVSRSMIEPVKDLKIDINRLSVLPMGVDFDTLFTPDESINRSKCEILFVGRLVEKKGLRILLESFLLVLQNRPDTMLTIAGYGPDKNFLHHFVHTNELTNRVRSLGAVPQSQLVLLYRRASLLVSPFVISGDGDQEGLGLVTIEAIACGCPVLVSDLPAVLDVLDPLEDSDFLFSPGNVPMLSEKILNLLNAQKVSADRIRHIRTRIRNRFDWNLVAEKYSQLIKESITEKICHR